MVGRQSAPLVDHRRIRVNLFEELAPEPIRLACHPPRAEAGTQRAQVVRIANGWAGRSLHRSGPLSLAGSDRSHLGPHRGTGAAGIAARRSADGVSEDVSISSFCGVHVGEQAAPRPAQRGFDAEIVHARKFARASAHCTSKSSTAGTLVQSAAVATERAPVIILLGDDG